VSLRCEYLANPLGVDVTPPRLSWKLRPTDAWARGQSQTAYQIQVASTEAGLRKGNPEYWDSGKIVSDRPVLVEYAGKPLRARMRCWWRVRVWDGESRRSNWSEPARWSMGLLRPEDWRAQWIGLDGGEEIRSVWKDAQWIWAQDAAASVVYFRRKFSLPEDAEIKSATITLIAAGGFVLMVNGRKAATGVGPIQAENVALVDIQDDLRPGENTVAVMARGGERQTSGLIGEVRIELGEGKSLIVSTDAHWRTSAKEEPGWETPAFSDGAWPAAGEFGPHGAALWPRLVDDDRRLPARMLRREFQVAGRMRRATAYVCGLGLFEFYLNGRKVGDHVMDPVQSRYDKRAMYVTFDVTALLKPGANAAGVILGNGRFFAPRVHVPVDTLSFGYPKLLFQMEIEYANGDSAAVTSDESWRLTAGGPIRANNEFDGEEYDARMEQ
jgi:alpha-L-rhamnosidase